MKTTVNFEPTMPAPVGATDVVANSTYGRKLKILHITEAPRGGVLTHLCEVIKGQAVSPGVAEIHVLSPDVNAPVLNSIAGNKVSLRFFSCRRGSVQGLLRLALGTIRVVRETRPDVVHVHSTIAGFVCRLILLCLIRKPKIIYCPHGWPFTAAGRWRPLATRVERFLSFASSSIVCISESEQRTAVAIGIDPDKCNLILNGISEKGPCGGKILPIMTRGRRERLNIAFIGRFDRAKGFDIYLDVMRRLADIADGTAAGDYLVNSSRPIDLPPNVKILGWCDAAGISALHHDADLILMPSRWEGLPLAALEAMRAKRAVFASRVGGLPEIVVDGVTGRLLDFADTVGAAEAIRTTSFETLSGYGQQGFERFGAKFTARQMNLRLLQHYDDILDSRTDCPRA